MKKLTKTRVIIKRSRVLLENKVARKSGTTTVLPAIAANTNSNNFRGLVLITRPCLLTKVLPSSIQQTQFKKIINQCTKVKEIINVTNPSKLKFGIDENHSLNIILKAVAAKNIRFRKLSLFSRTSIKPIISLAYTLKYKIISLIVSRLGVIRKAIRLLLVILLVNFSFIDCFTGNIDELIDKTEQDYAIPSGLLKSIARVESGNKPYALNIVGRPTIVNSKEEAASIVKFSQNAGISNIDLGIAQVNLRWYGKHFSSISEMLEPKSNLEYAAKLLNELYCKHGSWCKTVRHYHSANPDYHRKYSRRVLIAWLKGDNILNNINVK